VLSIANAMHPRVRSAALSTLTTFVFAIGLACEMPGGDSYNGGPPKPVAEGVTPGPSARTAVADAAAAAPEPVDSGPHECNFKAQGIAFDNGTCNDCMQKSCCAQTVACFVDVPDCNALYTCINACPSRGLPSGSGTGSDGGGDGGGGGNGMGGGDGGGDGGGGGAGDGGGANVPADPCVLDCKAKHPAAAQAATAYIGCYAQSCLSICR
jgi:hypothetical protein